MTDLAERALERRAAAGDPEASERLRVIACRKGLHEWDWWKCLHCGVRQADVEATQREHRQKLEREEQVRLCAQDNHTWEPGDERAEDCGCPSDPGIHGCHPRFCVVCCIGEEEWETEINGGERL